MCDLLLDQNVGRGKRWVEVVPKESSSRRPVKEGCPFAKVVPLISCGP